jgi:hypothetical protein
LIGDPRNHENVIVSQPQATMLPFHNEMVDQNPGTPRTPRSNVSFPGTIRGSAAEFLPTIVGQDAVFSVLPHLKSGTSILVDKPNSHFL